VPPVPFDRLRPGLEAVWGRKVEGVFADFQLEPFAAASIAQVHRAHLPDGTPVVVKVRRPDILPKIEADLRILNHLARIMELQMPDIRRYRPVQIVGQLKRSLLRELDLVKEARNLDTFAEHFRGDESIHIPRVYWEYCGESVNVQEELVGIQGTDIARAREAGYDLKLLAARGADAVLKMILLDGYFHADPHPGNVIYLPGNRIGMLDFGMVGRLSEFRRDQIVDLLAALSRRDERGMMQVLLDWTGEAAVDESRLALDLGELVFNYEHLELRDINIGQLLSDVTAIMRDHCIVLPADLALLFKALITLEGLGRRLDPGFRLVEYLRPFVRQVILARYEPRSMTKRLRHSLSDALAAVGGLPSDLVRLVRDARKGRLRVEFDLKRLDHFGHQIDHSANRLTLGVVTAALIVGSSIVMTVKGGPELFGLPLLGLLGFVVASLNAVWLVISIWRSNRK